jgi:selenocysteine lyase/cysteine desulfurase
LPIDSPVNLKDMLWNDFKIEVPIFDWGKRNFIRVSAHFYNDQKDMDHLIKALKEIF